MAKKPLPTPETLRQLLRYEPDTGKLYWSARPISMFSASRLGKENQCATWNSRWALKEAFTCTGPNGYRRGRVMSQNHQAHRVIWAMVYDAWPCGDVDHINRDRQDNRIANLRLASRSQNLSNTVVRPEGTSRFLGVCWSKSNNGWVAQTSWQKRHYYLGTFPTEELAARAFDDAALRLKGKFAKLNFPIEDA